MRRLLASPKQSVPLFKKHLVPVSADECTIIAKYIVELDDDHFPVRQRAETELVKRGPLAVPLVRKELEKQLPSLEARRRLERVLEKLPLSKLLSWRERERRSVLLLERIGSSDARELLKDLSKGAGSAPLTVEARQALERLEKK
jgi:hypothetical protein